MSSPPKKKNTVAHLFSGGVAGCCEAIACHPLDTIKVRLQIRGERALLQKSAPPKSNNFIAVGIQIAQKEGILSSF